MYDRMVGSAKGQLYLLLSHNNHFLITPPIPNWFTSVIKINSKLYSHFDILLLKAKLKIKDLTKTKKTYKIYIIERKSTMSLSHPFASMFSCGLEVNAFNSIFLLLELTINYVFFIGNFSYVVVYVYCLTPMLKIF